jgi:hypothetical protein
MSTLVRLVRVFVSSPIDVAAERGRVQAVAATLNREYQGLVSFETVLWEEHFYKADRSFQPQIAESVACDIVVSIFWTRPILHACPTAGLQGGPADARVGYLQSTIWDANNLRLCPDFIPVRRWPANVIEIDSLLAFNQPVFAKGTVGFETGIGREITLARAGWKRIAG